jgi:hypothetical protein
VIDKTFNQMHNDWGQASRNGTRQVNNYQREAGVPASPFFVFEPFGVNFGTRNSSIRLAPADAPIPINAFSKVSRAPFRSFAG